MNYGFNAAKTPGGAMLGQRILIDGKPGLHYKAGKKEDDLTVEQLVECVSGKKVVKILYQKEEDLKKKDDPQQEKDHQCEDDLQQEEDFLEEDDLLPASGE